MDDEDLKVLQNHPSITQLNAILFKPTVSSLQEFKLVNILIENIIELFDDLTKPLQRRVISIFVSLNGISSLINQLKLCIASTKPRALKCLTILNKVLQQDHLLYELISNESSTIKLTEIKNLFLGSKILNIYSKLDIELGIQSDYSKKDVYVVKMQKEFCYLLEKNFVEYNYLANLIVSLLRLSEESLLIFDFLFSEIYVNKFYLIYNNSRAHKSTLSSSIIKYINQITRSGVQHAELISIISHFQFGFGEFESAINYSNIHLLQILVPSIDERKRFEYIMKSLKVWGDVSYIGRTPLALQESYTNLIILLIQATKESDLLRFSQDPDFLDAMTNRISSTSGRIRSLGMLVGNLLFSTLGKDMIFKIDEEIEFQQNYMKKFNNELKTEVAYDNRVVETNSKFNKMVLIDTDEEMDDDPEDSDDDPTIADRSKPNKPLFLKELISYLNADSKNDKHSHDKLVLALKYGPKLILRSSVKNLNFYNEQLISLLIGLTNENEDSDFDEMRLKCLISSCVHDSVDAANILMRKFVTGDYSLQQRLVILSTLSLAVRYLRGYEDDNFNVDKSMVNFKSKLLPSSIHRQFVEFSPGTYDSISIIENSLELDIVDETMARNKDKIMGEGKVLRISSKLRNPNKKSEKLIKPRIPGFFKIVGTSFFFPLTSVWFSLNQLGSLQLGKFSAILSAHFLKSIGIILQTAFPSANDLQDIVKSALEIVVSLSTSLIRIKEDDKNDQDLLVLDALIFIVIVILDNSSAQFLVDFYLNELVIIRNFVLGLINEQMGSLGIDEFLVQKIFTVALRLNEIFDQFQRSLVGIDGLD